MDNDDSGSGEGSGGHFHGFSGGPGRDRYIQNIIGHTNGLLSDHDYQSFQFTTLGGTNRNGILMNQLDHEQEVEDDRGLDEFDRRLLGRPQRPSHFHGSEYHDHRLSIPLATTPVHPRRVVGDASHHFRPSVVQETHQPPPFPSLSSYLGAVEPSPASRLIFERDRASRIGELQSGAQTRTPPFYAAPNATSSLSNSLTSSSPTYLTGSSPSARLSLRQRANATDTPLVTQKRANTLNLNLDHAPDEPPVVSGTRLVDPRQALPDKFRTVFPYKLFNVIQSKCFPLVYGTNDNVVVSAPTGSGKTAILELAICKLVMTPGSENFKIVYQAPTKSLCSERARDWEKKFSHMNLRCIELTGDTSQAQASRVGSASIIVTTPEKWDSITRKWSDHRKLLEMVRLVLIDEVHILKDARGATLEAVVSRMKTIGANIRFVALSATVPNIEDIAKWLGRDHSNQQEPARAEVFGEELRPVRLQRYVYGYQGHSNDFIFDNSLDGKLKMLLAKHSKQKPIMIFCFTRKSCETTARQLAEWWSTCKAEDRAWPAPTRRVPVTSRELQEIVRYGVAFHHAGLDAQDRSAVSDNFLEGQIHVICCTSTLAVGVNLPCHTVVLKGTVGYSDGKPQEYSDLEVMQMLGRAGRPQFDDSAVAIIMTKTTNVDRYKRMISGDEILESTLHRNLVEHLNSEISLGTIQDVQTAKKWIAGTFLSVRVRQSPSLYHLQDVRNAEDADKKMEEWCERDVKLLQQYDLVTEQAPFKCTEYGHAMSRYMVNFETMKLLMSIPRGAGIQEILTSLCLAVELKEFRFKPDERALFRELNKSPFILHPIKETLAQTWHKVFLMVQIHLGGVELPSEKGQGHLRYRFAADKTAIFDRLNRLVRCFVDCRAIDCDGYSTKAGLELARGLAANSWENKPSQLSQIPGFGPVTVRKWVGHGVYTVLGLADRGFDEIERISSRNPPYGMNLLKTLEAFPRLAMEAHINTATAHRPNPQDDVTVVMKVNLRYTNTKGVPKWNNKVPAATFMALTTDGNLTYFWRGNLRSIDESTGLELKFPVALSGPEQKISCYFSCEEIVGTQVSKTLEPGIPEAAFKNKRSHVASLQTPVVNSLDDMDFDDLADEDMMSAVPTSTSQHDDLESLDFAEPLDGNEDDFPLIDTILSQDTSPSVFEPMKMDNGRWMCNHRCRNGGLTASGKTCTHKCCHEGLYRPRPPAREKKKSKATAGSEEDESGPSVGPSTKQSQSSHKASKGKGIARNLSAPTHGSWESHHLVTQSNIKRKRTLPDEERAERLLKRREKSQEHRSKLNELSDIECIDLSALSNDDELSQPLSTAPSFCGKGNLPGSSDVALGKEGDLSLDCPKTQSQGGTDVAMGFGDADGLYDSNIFEEDDELPELESLIQSNESKDVDMFQKTSGKDETLYPGVVQTLRESVDNG
ncbi:P-loop containing nucleoside triphosphate hydrolase protein [Hypomontagnella submonticulosa]|nr:P-loop containing nucleoside triphosphate hydrolase protein [Hypomontagnella submonticulosa]